MRKLITTLILAACVTGTGAAVSLHVRHVRTASGVTASRGFAMPHPNPVTPARHF